MDVLAAISLAAWLFLITVHGQYWRTSVRLPDSAPPGSWPSVAIVVPARNEAAMLRVTLPSLAAQDYPGPARIVVVDDGSTDGTGSIAGAAPKGRLPVTVLRGQARPPGWAGKLWALHQGIAHAQGVAAASPGSAEWLLLTDADIRHGRSSLRRLVAAALDGDRDLVSVMARLRAETGWERLLVPAFVYFFGQLYPFRRVAKGGSTAAAAGGCVLLRATTMAAAGGIAAVRSAVIDDVALARQLKRRGARLWLGFADDVDSVRPYPKLADLWHMVARSAFTQLRYQLPLLVAVLAGLALVYVAPVVVGVAGALSGDWLACAGGFLAYLLMNATYLPTVRYYRLCWPWAMTLPLAAAMYGAMTADSARRHFRGGVEWKGRRYEAG